MSLSVLNINDSVAAQYEALPYPPRAPEDEAKRLIPPALDCLDALNHYGFGGRRDFTKDFRALVAGCGTGDSVVFLAEQLRGTEAEIHALDMSEAALAVAKARVEKRGLTNVIWHRRSLLEAPALGTFDYINCSGVLHHLASPEAGIAALEGALARGGVMGIMLYGAYGRTGIYHLQSLFQCLRREGETHTEEIARARAVLSSLPSTHAFARTAEWFNDIRHHGDAGLYDLLLHHRDRGYTVPEVYALLDSAGLALTQWIGPEEAFGNRAYLPEMFMKDERLHAELGALDARRRAEVAELLSGRLTKHSFYAAREEAAPPSPEDLEMIPSLPLCTDPAMVEKIAEAVARAGATVTLKTASDTVTFQNTPHAALLFRFIDGTRSLGEIFRAAMEQAGKRGKRPSLPELGAEFRTIYERLNGTLYNNTCWLYLRHKNVPAYRTLTQMG